MFWFVCGFLISSNFYPNYSNTKSDNHHTAGPGYSVRNATKYLCLICSNWCCKATQCYRCSWTWNSSLYQEAGAQKWKHIEYSCQLKKVSASCHWFTNSPSTLHAWEVLPSQQYLIHTIYPACQVPQMLHLHLLWPRRSHCSASPCRRKVFS